MKEKYIDGDDSEFKDLIYYNLSPAKNLLNKNN